MSSLVEQQTEAGYSASEGEGEVRLHLLVATAHSPDDGGPTFYKLLSMVLLFSAADDSVTVEDELLFGR